MDGLDRSTLSPAEAERFWGEGTDAVTREAAEAAVSQPTCNCERIMATAEYIHAADCPARPKLAAHSGRGHVAGEVPMPLRGLVGGVDSERNFDPGLNGAAELLRDFPEPAVSAMVELIDRLRAQRSAVDALVGALLFAARDCAQRNIGVCATSGAFDRKPVGECRECFMVERIGGRIPHAPSCSTGRVMHLLSEILAVSKAGSGEKSIGEQLKEAREEASKPEAATVTKSVTDTPYDWAGELKCSACGQAGGEGWSLLSQQSHCSRVLLPNECLLRKGGWYYVYGHHCAAKGGAR